MVHEIAESKDTSIIDRVFNELLCSSPMIFDDCR